MIGAAFIRGLVYIIKSFLEKHGPFSCLLVLFHRVICIIDQYFFWRQMTFSRLLIHGRADCQCLAQKVEV